MPRLADAYEQAAWKGTRWKVRNQTFVSVIAIDDSDGDRSVVVAFRSERHEVAMLRRAGHPFFALRWGHDTLGMVLNDDTDWSEVAELITDSYRVRAPKKLVVQVDRPEP